MRERKRKFPNKMSLRKSLVCMALAGITLAGPMLWGQSGMTAQAAALMSFWGNGDDSEMTVNENFSISAQMIASDADNYRISITVANTGADWEGTVRVIPGEEYYGAAAYDIALSLPQNSTKQFMVSVPKFSMEEPDGDVTVCFLNSREKVVHMEVFQGLMEDTTQAIYMGILSDDYDKLTYLDMGGRDIHYYNDYYPIKLVEVTQDNLTDTLNTLDFLVVDNYTTSILADEQIKEIENWNMDRGVLIVGTGSNAAEVTSGFDRFEPGYLSVDCMQTSDFQPIGDPSVLESVDVEVPKLQVAELWDSYYQYDNVYEYGELAKSYGNGAVGILPYSLTELASVEEDYFVYFHGSRDNFMMQRLEDISMMANARYTDVYNNYFSYDSSMGSAQNLLAMIGKCNSPLHFGILKVIIILYVIFAGPILYLILKAAKKREFYWLAVPATALVTIFLVFLAGRGFEVTNSRAFTVTTKNLSVPGDMTTYLYCYNAKFKEWDLQLAEGYDSVGDMWNEEYRYYGNSYGDDMADDYYHHIKMEGDRLSFGIIPSSNFEDSYFVASGNDGKDSGQILCQNIMADGWGGVIGTVTNQTDKDFLYYAVICNGTIYLYEKLPKGGTSDLATADCIYASDGNGYSSVWRDYLWFTDKDLNKRKYEKAAAQCALGMGICDAYRESNINVTMVIGVTDDWNDTIDDNCNEVSYGCLYAVQ